LQKYFDFITDDVVQSSTWLAGGGDQATEGSCGALSAGIMALCAKYGPRAKVLSPEEKEKFDKARDNAHEFRDWFIEKFGGATCRDVQVWLLGRSFNLMDAEERKAKKECHQKVGREFNEISAATAVKVAEMLAREAVD